MTESIIRKACQCGILIEHCENQSIPLIKKDNKILLVLTNKRREIIQFCFFCGGYETGPATEQTYKCGCKILEEWSKDIVSSVKFDEKFYEYYLEGIDGSTSVFYFCPVCGGKLTKSKRDDFSIAPSESEINKVYERIRNAVTISEIINIIGLPDEKIVTDSTEVKKQKFLGLNPIKQTLIYHSVADTFSLIVIEDGNGKIDFLTAGKLKTNFNRELQL